MKVLRSWRGAISSTALRWAFVMVKTRSALEAILGLSCLAEKLEASPPNPLRTAAASRCTGWPITACKPALDAVKSGISNWRFNATASRSAVGERQMFPVQMNRICRVSPRLGRHGLQ